LDWIEALPRKVRSVEALNRLKMKVVWFCAETNTGRREVNTANTTALPAIIVEEALRDRAFV